MSLDNTARAATIRQPRVIYSPNVNAAMPTFLRQLFKPESEPERRADPHKLGAFIGVYTPTVLTILGVIMYLRFGWVLGQVGLLKTLLIVLLANSITVVTTLCLSAVATNTRVGVGGAYFIISRSLGLEIGGAIGVPLFLSQAFSVTLYAFGLAESLTIVWPGAPVPLSAFIITLGVGALALRGAGAALRIQLPILGLIVLSLLALALGSFWHGEVNRLWNGGGGGGTENFWAVFAVFFPAVTGIMAGLSLSGDLQDPRQSIPRGSLLAVLTGFAVYLLVPLLLCIGADPLTLREEPMIWSRIAPLGAWLILPGLWGAIFSSAVGSMLGAPRTLQALAFDRLAPKWLEKTGGKAAEPIFGIVLTLGIALTAIFLGNLNAVAIVVSMFFLTVYGTLNLVAALEGLSGNPSWRPSIQIPWWLSLCGALACFSVMLLINVPASLAAVAIELGIWTLLKRRERRGRWGNLWRDIWEAVIHAALHRLAGHPMTARNWRPHILVFCGHVEDRLPLLRFADWFSEGRGLVTVCELQIGDLLALDLDIEARRQEVDALLEREGIDAFGEVHVVQDIERGIVAVAQANGIAGIASNTVLIGWPDERERLVALLRVGRSLQRLNKSLLIGNIREIKPPREGERRRIHIWWGGLQRNGDLILLLAYLLTCNSEWRTSRIRILSIASNKLMQRKTLQFLEQLVPEIRIEADISVMLKEEKVSVREMIHKTSADADLVLMGLALPEGGEEAVYAQRLCDMVEGLKNWILVRNGSLFIGDLVSPESSDVGDDEEEADKKPKETKSAELTE
jgi:solute carrier family 12 (potassium/chloride transporter), member 4/6